MTALAGLTGIRAGTMQAILNGEQSLTMDSAVQIGTALDPGSEVWLNLDAANQRTKTRG